RYSRPPQPSPANPVSSYLSCNPALISAELLRAMQDGWWEKVPNRRYSRFDPNIDLNHRSGSFQGSLVEESQPVPFAINGLQGDRTFASGDPQLVTAINVYGLSMVVVAAFSCIWLAQRLQVSLSQVLPLIAYTTFFWVIATSAFDVARSLALRFDFKSSLYWMEYEGNYTAAEVSQGNRYKSTIHSSSQVVQVEGMTFRLWVAEAHSITFGKDAQRYIYSLIGLPDVASALANRLRDFVMNQSSLLSLGSHSDQERMRAVAQMNTQGGEAPPMLTRD
ncbi:hypothetical protein, partial [uncultured Sphingomonas sp.]|uniref:hypothetical protein n=1 Tax=uncultured Sphingomonas sp. TaxID=158754 RepID=UPI0035CB0ABC